LVPSVTHYGFIPQQYLLGESIVLDVAMCDANSFIIFKRIVRHVTYKICNY